eukprot:CAMPEP_0198600456 /NCGR_PEP_ID=MMETSP1462-20131121/148259_1 /TAXON_ID=1333877 /ORGANISM="Brandtodinium nutriculum, Strain RCC3387" /LENGTH=44 /DNA_ID= /DNA_START= /DNA_END= /DNA_ORIENTATION=
MAVAEHWSFPRVYQKFHVGTRDIDLSRDKHQPLINGATYDLGVS